MAHFKFSLRGYNHGTNILSLPTCSYMTKLLPTRYLRVPHTAVYLEEPQAVLTAMWRSPWRSPQGMSIQ